MGSLRRWPTLPHRRELRLAQDRLTDAEQASRKSLTGPPPNLAMSGKPTGRVRKGLTFYTQFTQPHQIGQIRREFLTKVAKVSKKGLLTLAVPLNITSVIAQDRFIPHITDASSDFKTLLIFENVTTEAVV